MPPQGRTKGPKLKPSDAENLHGTETGRATLSHTRLSSFLNCPPIEPEPPPGESP